MANKTNIFRKDFDVQLGLAVVKGKKGKKNYNATGTTQIYLVFYLQINFWSLLLILVFLV